MQQLQGKFAYFARHECPDDPLYVALTDAAADRPEWAALLGAAPPTQQSPTLWLAALQDRVLELVEQGRRPPLAEYYASAEGRRAPDDDFAVALAEFMAREQVALRDRIVSRTTQTNEIGRCAVLWPILHALMNRTGRRRIALLDVGCSAGLNLGVDRWRYRHVDDLSGQAVEGLSPTRATSASAEIPQITCRVVAQVAQRPDDRAVALPAAGVTPDIVSRLGIDPNPVSVDDAAAVRWLRACLWPSDAARRERFDAAVRVARDQRWPLQATTDTTAAIGAWLDAIPDGVQPVVFNSWVLAYVDASTLRAHVAQLERRVVERDAVWISAEAPALTRSWWPDLPAPRPLVPGSSIATPELAASTAWVLRGPTDAAALRGIWPHVLTRMAAGCSGRREGAAGNRTIGARGQRAGR